MTWYASQIMTLGTPAVISTVKRSSLLSDHAFHVTNPLDHKWHTPEVMHNVPPEGLVFIRPICDPADHIAEWYDHDILSWEQFEHADGCEVELGPQAIARRRPEWTTSLFPAVEVLRVAKKLSAVTSTPVAFYYCFCWGGDVEVEYAWIFGNSERVLIRSKKDGSQSVNGFLEFTCDHELECDEDVLVRTLQSLSCALPTPFFAPHARGFPWHLHRLSPA